MASEYSIYADAEAAPPEWKPGEENAAIAFLAMTLLLVLDVNIGIHRVFRRKQGLYFWSLAIATWACALYTIGILLRNFKANWGPKIWPLWTVLILCGWSTLATAECVVLYSRLHLVNRSYKVQRWVLIMIVVGALALVLPNCVAIFPAYDVNSAKISSVWSPRMAAVDRSSQLGFSSIESVISAIYIASLIKILKVKSTIRQRRVMVDLIYVNVIVICLDIIVTVLTFLNRVNLAYPMQVFSYALKLKLEFVVLNQLMAVAAKGVKRESFAERRYNTKLGTDQSNDATEELALQDFGGETPDPRSRIETNNSTTLTSPPPTHTKQKKTSRDAYERMDSENESKKSDESSYDIHLKPEPQHLPDKNNHPVDTNVTATRHLPRRMRKQRRDEGEDEEDEIGLHMWENRGKLVLDVPWLDNGKEGA